MKSPLYTLPLLLLVLLGVNTRSIGQPHSDPTGLSELGAPTNGIRGGVSINWNYGQPQSPDIAVFLCQVPETNVSSSASGSGSNDWRGVFYFGGEDLTRLTNHDMPHRPPQYYMATNSFCGPIELRDAAGLQVRLLQLPVSSPEAYPASYSLRLMEGILAGHYVMYSGPPLPTPLLTSAPQLVRFHLEDYFAVTHPGKYRLTVWPKIYKRAAKDPDVCERMDLPPVSVTLKWNGQAWK